MHVCMPKHKAPLPLIVSSQEFSLLFMLAQSENVYKLKGKDQDRKAPGSTYRLEIQWERWQKSSAMKPAPEVSIFGILRHST